MTKGLLSDRWTILHHDPRRETSRGVAPETWLCVDCGVNTAPGMSTRKEIDVAFAIYGEATQTMTLDQEVYTVTAEVWRATGLEDMGGCLCIGCLEKRIRRRLKPKDFLAGHALKSHISGITATAKATGRVSIHDHPASRPSNKGQALPPGGNRVAILPRIL